MMGIRLPNKTFYALPLLVAVLLFLPMLSENGQLPLDWVNSYWLGVNASRSNLPNWDFNPIADYPALTPWFLYYGGYFFFLLGKVFVLSIGHTLFAYKLFYVVLATLYCVSISVLSRRLGLHHAYAALLGVLALCAPYYLANAFGWGDLAEFAFVSFLPCALASVVIIFRPRNRREAILAVMSSTFFMTLLLTTHVVSLVIVLVVSALIVGLTVLCILAFQQLRLRIWSYLCAHQRAIYAVSFAVLATMAFASSQLVPALRTARKTATGSTNDMGSAFELSSFSEVFSFTPHTSDFSTTPNLTSQTLTSLLLWALIFSIVAWRRATPSWRIIALVIVAVGVALVVIACIPGAWIWLPQIIRAVQFPYRYVTYITFIVLVFAGMVLFQLQNSRRMKVFVTMTLLIVAVATVIPSFLQVYSPEKRPHWVETQGIDAANPPATWYAGDGSFRLIGQFPETPPASARVTMLGSSTAQVEFVCSGAKLTSLPVGLSPPLAVSTDSKLVGSDSRGFAVID